MFMKMLHVRKFCSVWLHYTWPCLWSFTV